MEETLDQRIERIEAEQRLGQTCEIAELDKAVFLAQAAINQITKTGENKHYHSTYATFEDLMNGCKEPLAAQQLSISHFYRERANGAIHLVTKLNHTRSGQWRESIFPMPIPKNPQEVGSYTTYMKRYSILLLLNLITSDGDDDGELIAKRVREEEEQKKKQEFNDKLIEKGPALSIIGKLEKKKHLIESFLEEFNIARVSELTNRQYKKAMEWIEKHEN